MAKQKIKANNTVNLISIFEEYISQKRILNTSKATITSYTNTFHSFYNCCKNDLTSQGINQYIECLRKRNCKATTINHELRHLRAFANWASDNAYIPKIKIPLLTEEESIKPTFSNIELKKLLKRPSHNASFTVWRSWATVNWLLATGNRFGTLQEIRMEDINLTDCEVYLRHTKNRKVQVIPMSNALTASIRFYINMWRSNASPSDYLFCDVYGNAISHNALFLSIKKYCLERGVNKYGIHIFRHTFAKQFILNGGGVFQLQKILGHSTLDMTKKYVNLYANDIKQDIQNYNPLDNLNHTYKIRKAI